MVLSLSRRHIAALSQVRWLSLNAHAETIRYLRAVDFSHSESIIAVDEADTVRRKMIVKAN